ARDLFSRVAAASADRAKAVLAPSLSLSRTADGDVRGNRRVLRRAAGAARQYSEPFKPRRYDAKLECALIARLLTGATQGMSTHAASRPTLWRPYSPSCRRYTAI